MATMRPGEFLMVAFVFSHRLELVVLLIVIVAVWLLLSALWGDGSSRNPSR